MAAGGTGWFASSYFASNYWADEYWAEAGTEAGGFWTDQYWAPNFWATNYWKLASGGVGDVFVTDDATLTLAAFVPTLAVGADILSTTEVLTLTAFDVSAANVIEIAATQPSLSMTGYSIDVSGSAYTLGDITYTVGVNSTITITNGAAPAAGGSSLTAFAPTTSTPDGLSVGVGRPSELGLSAFPVIANNNVRVEPLPASMTLTNFDSPAAGIGWLIDPPRVQRTLHTGITTIAGVPIVSLRPQPASPLELTTYLHFVFGRVPYSLPPPTFAGDESITNDSASEYPSSYEICDRTGFRVRRGGLREEWTGAMVREKSWERRNAQDFVRGVGDEQEGSPRPEQDEVYVFERYPAGVTADDL